MNLPATDLPRPVPPLPIIQEDAPLAFHQLVYVSSAAAVFSPAELTTLLDQSRRRNALNELSGILLYHDGNFMQLLEGREPTVRATYARIVRDPRHHGCMILIQHEVAERTFPDWTMGFRDFRSEEVKMMPGYSGFLNHDARGDSFPTDPNRALTLLRTFRSRLH